MKSFITFLLIVILGICTQADAQNFWQTPTGPYGPNEWNRIHKGADGKIYLYADTILVSTDNGSTWSGITTRDSQEWNYFQVFYANSTTDMYGGGFYALKRTTDGGAHWNPVNLGLSPISIYSFVSAANGNFYVGTNNHVFRSTDSGVNWTRLTSGFSEASIRSLAVTSNNNVIAGTDKKLYVSTNNGGSWTSAGLTEAYYKSLAAGPGGRVVAGSTLGVFVSTDNGATWADRSSGLPDSSCSAVAIDGSGNLFVSTTGSGPFFSSNNGTTWSSISTGLPYKFIDGFAFTGTHLIAISRAAVYQSTNSGTSWTSVTAGFPLIGARGIYVHSNGTVFAGSFGGQFSSTDNGTTWVQAHNGLPGNVIVSWLEMPGNVLLAGTYYGGLYSSSDGGTNWSFLSQKGLRVEGLVKDGGGTLYHANDGGAFKSTDNGQTWSRDTAGLGSTYTNTMMIAANGSRYASSNKGVYRWKTGETQWSRVLGAGSFYIAIETIAASGSNLLTNIGYSPTATEKGVWRSTNDGDTWTHIVSPDSAVQRITVNSLGHVYLASKTGVYKSTNNGDDWTQVSTNVWTGTSKTNVSVNAFAFTSSGILFVGTSAGIYRSAGSTTGVEQISSEIPSQFSLAQNYPNPFNPSTTIKFSIPKSSFVTLKVYDVLGKEAAQLVNENLNAGTYNYNFDASKLSSGIYFYTIRSENFVQTKKMIMIK